jgi:hypothetical protein
MELRRRVRFVPLSGAPSLLSVLSCVVLVGTKFLETFINALQSVVRKSDGKA